MKKIFSRELLTKVIVEHQQRLQSLEVITRDVMLEKNGNYVFTGLRRAGKTYLLYQYIQSSVSVENQENLLYINFEDERLLGIDVSDLDLFLEVYYSLHTAKPLICLDEVHVVPGWQLFARRLADQNYRVMITGSNAGMLSNDIATTLGGRYFNKEVMPLSFREFLKFQGIEPSSAFAFSKERFEIKRMYSEYLTYGGFPELIKYTDKREYLSGVYQKLFYGDVIGRYQIANQHALKLLVKKLAESVNNETSVNRIKNLVKSTGVALGNNTLFDYLQHLHDAFLIMPVQNYYSKFSERESSKKYYFRDTGILNLFLMDQNTKLLENLVFLHLYRTGHEMYFLKRALEVDFYVPNTGLLVQSCWTLSNPETRKREIKALAGAMKEFSLSESWIITHDETDEIDIPQGKIKVIPAWRWLLL